MSHEVRRLPKKTIIIISIISVFILIAFLFLQMLKEQKMVEILETLGHKDVKSLKVVNKLSVEDMQTRFKSSVYKLVFFDNELQKNCVGFISKEKDGSYAKDFDCK